MRGLCRHCNRVPCNRPRGLCWSCYYRPGVREQYPSTSKYARRGDGIGTAGRAPPEPTAARPGTPEKVDVMRRRVLAGEAVFHGKDAPMDGPDARPVIHARRTRRQGKHSKRGRPPGPRVSS